jgi:iron(III) transport system ATP-binding protein
VEQIGTPEDVYQKPNSEFVARFIGGTNILHGKPDGQAVRCGPLVIECGNAVTGSAAGTPVSIRPGDVEIGTAPALSGGRNAFTATVLRHTYLGGQRDYLLELPGSQQIRAVTPLRTRAEVGSTVEVAAPQPLRAAQSASVAATET